MTGPADGMMIERGSEVTANGRRFVITHVLDLDAVMARDPATGLSERLLIADLLPVDHNEEVTTASPDLSEIDGRDWDEARQRLNLLKNFLGCSRTVRSEIEKAAASYGVEASTVYRWLRRYRVTGKLSSLLPARSNGGRGKSRLPNDVEDIIRVAIETYHLKKQQPSVRATANEVKRLCRNAGVSPPHENTIRARISSLSEGERLRQRGHAKEASDRFEARPGKFDAATHPLSVVQIDHTLLNVMLVDEEERRSIGRPWLTLACDVYSRMVVGFVVSLDPPGASSTGLCLTHAILPKEKWLARRGIATQWPCWGFPAAIHMDNAREFHGEMLRRACDEYSIEIDFRVIAKPHYGSHIERLMGTLSTGLETLEGATFASPSKRGDYDSENLASMTLIEFEVWLTEFITGVYHQRLHKGLGMSPLQRWREAIMGTTNQPGIGIPKRPADEDRIRLDFMPFVERTVQQYGVQIDDIRYYSDALRRHINTTSRNGKRTFIFRRDPRDISVIYFWDPDLKQYAELPYRNSARPPMSLWELRATKSELIKQGRANIDEEAIFETYERLRVHQEQATKATKRARRLNERRKAGARREKVQLPQAASVDFDWPTNIEPFEIFDV